MGLLHLQSPFSILGLKYSDYTSKKIQSAYKTASLRCHPDKNPGPDIPETYFTLLGEARSHILKGGLQLDQFKGYPVIFYPQRDNIEKPIFKIPKSSAFAVCECGEILPKLSALCNTQGCQRLTCKIFKICYACKTPIPEEGLNRHLSQHTDICHICNEVMEKDHYSVRHPEKKCPLCPALNEKDHHLSHALQSCFSCDVLKKGGPTGLVEHIRQDHFNCPLCGQKCGDKYGDHLFEVHNFEQQNCCVGDLNHYGKAHQWLQCPYHECELHIAEGKLFVHMAKSHVFERCSDCSRSEKGFIQDEAHMKAHAFKDCPDCPECTDPFYITNLPHHLVSDHDWLLCLYCDRAERSEDEIKDHIKEDHRLTACSICQQEHLEEETDIHLLDLHDWLKCSWCNKAFAEEDLRTHIAVSHPPQEFCDCNYKDTVPGLKIHKMQSHAWQQCPYCENIEPPDRIEQHMNSHQLMTCQECNMRFLPDQERAHFQQTHQYLQCSFCEHFNSHSKMLIHMQSHLSQSQLQPNPGLSIPSAKFQDIPVQFQEEENPARSYDSIKCAYCRKRKRKVRTNNPNISIRTNSIMAVYLYWYE